MKTELKRSYDFDEIIERRHTNALNTDGFRSYIFHAGPEKKFPYKDEEFVRMWVADMEFATPPEICEAMKKRIDKRIFGYSMVFDSDYYNVLQKWCREKYDWEFPRKELCFSSGIIPALYELTEDLLSKNEKMMIVTPAYGYFKHTAEYNNVELVCSNLKNDGGEFTIDFDDFEKKASDPHMKLILWCNPHNPTGRMWTAQELTKVAKIVEKYNLWIISDEIHCDLIRKNNKHIPMGKIMKDYEKCGKWLEELKDYLDDNFQFLKDYLQENLPEAVYQIPEATYLAWVDMKVCLPDIENLPDFFANRAGVLLEGGDDLFVGNANGFIRLNMAMPRETIKKGLDRMVQAIREYQNEK